ncbi:MAG: glycosyltransferase family 39 protein, partial [Candidatus Hydrogenedentes bacterium]|nr:glycosyltransferase family 39 protein [Candidatus Hydrogenedentota bacterium]
MAVSAEEPATDNTLHGTARLDWDKAGAVFVLVILGSIALVLRLVEFNASFWVDEILTVRNGMKPVADILNDHLTPLIFLVTHYMLKVDDSEAWVRLPFLVAGMAGIVCAYFSGSAAGGRVNGLIAAFLLTFSAFHINLSQEARYYAPLLLAYFLGIVLLHRCMTRGTFLDWLLYAVVLALGLLTHLSMVFFFFWANAAAFVYLLLKPGSLKHRMRRILALVLCTVAAATPLGLRVLTMGSPVSANVAVSEAGAEDAGMTLIARNAETAPQNAGQYLLEANQLPAFFREYFPAQVGLYHWVGIALGIVGLIRIWIGNPAMAVLLTFLLFGVPIPLFFIHVSHWYNAKYVCVLMAAALLILSIGVTGVTAMAAQAMHRVVCRRWTDCRLWPVMPSTSTAFVFLMLLVLFVSPAIAHGLRTHYAARPETDWKGAARYMAPVMDARDVVVYVPWPTSRPVSNTYWKHVMAEPLNFYLERELAQPGQVINTIVQSGASDWAGIRDLATKNPLPTMWIVLGDEIRQKEADRAALETFAPDRGEFGRISVRVRGGATANLTPLGGFEENVDQVLQPQMEVANDSPGFSGVQAVKITATEPAFAVAALPVRPALYPVRNAGFEFWKDGSPVGWELRGTTAAQSADAEAGRGSAALAPGAVAGAFRQVLESPPGPGAPVLLTALAKASAATTLRIALTYEMAGAAGELAQTFPATGDWQPLKLTGAIPGGAERRSVAIEVGRSAGADTPVQVDHVTLERSPRASTLDPSTDYVLSLKMKCEDVQAGEDPSRVVKVTLSGTRSDGESFWQGLAKLEGTRPWERYTFRLLPGR